MARLAIKGHATRGREVIELLKMLGGFNSYTYEGCERNSIFTISNYSSIIKVFPSTDYAIFTLEEFLEKFPYKVGDKVNSPCKGCIKTITSMKWDTYLNTVTYKLDNWIYTNIDRLKVVNDLQPYKEEIMENKENFIALRNEQLEVHSLQCDKVKLIINDEHELIQEDGDYYIVRKKTSIYPKTYEECCSVVGFCSDTLKWNNPFHINRDTHPYIKHLDNLMEIFCKLRICRDAYWKLYGEKMGLGKPWEPDWSSCEDKFCITIFKNKQTFDDSQYISRILAFPTEEMRDVFYENFKDLIESCKELL